MIWLARDSGGDLYVHASRPYAAPVEKNTWEWLSDNSWMRLDNDLYPELQPGTAAPMLLNLTPSLILHRTDRRIAP